MNKPVIMLCPTCKKAYGRQIAVKIIEAYDCVGVWVFDVICREGHLDTVEIEKEEQ
jgi:hypothetical protein